MKQPPFASRWNLAAIEPAYERWRETAEYREWRRETGQAGDGGGE